MQPADRLETYNRKRDFSKTPEPPGKLARTRRSKLSFLVQKHAATRLHYDLRLEWEGVLWSWAVTRGPSADPAQKRLAVRTEDHPLSYGDFEGTIQKGEYGGGTVMLWDEGTWEPIDDPATGIEKGKLHFRINGQRMKGGWILVRIGNRKEGTRPGKKAAENWLLIKERDEQAVEDPDELVETHTTSIKTGRGMDAITGAEPPLKAAAKRRAPASDKKTARSAGASEGKAGALPTPAFQKPQLATLIDTAPAGEDWLHEIKFDGYRCLAAIGKGGVKLYTRSGLDWSERFGHLLPSFEGLPCRSALIDGEVMAGDGEATSAFSALQDSLKSGAPLVFYAFDLLSLDGENLKDLPLLERKKRLEDLLSRQDGNSALRYSTHITGHGQQIYEKVCRSGGEGIVSKRADSSYRGTRTKTWLKVKCTRRQEFVVGGYSPSTKRGRPFSSLLVGDFDAGTFRYRGRVGSGYSASDMEELAEAMRAMSSKTSHFDSVPASQRKSAQWVTPRLVVEVDFAEFTADGHIRHGVFLGRREDKPAREVKLEESSRPGTGKKDESEVAGVRISSSTREVFPKAGITKHDLASYYEMAGERIVEIAGHRPFSLVRCPKGLRGECFFQKHASKGFPAELHGVDITESSGKVAQYLYVQSTKGLVAAAQMGVIEFHIWGTRIDKLERPDRLVFDLDPEEGLHFDQVRAGAFTVRDKLDYLGLKSTPMLTGGKGIHVCVPLRRTVSWETLKIFAKTLATIMADQEPERFTATMSKAKRKGKIFIDWLRNDRGATAIAPYSVRARPGAPVATPVTWQELESLDRGNAFSVPDMKKRLDRACPYLAALKSPQSLGKPALARLEKMTRSPE